MVSLEEKCFRQAQDGMPSPIAVLQASRLPGQPFYPQWQWLPFPKFLQRPPPR